MPFEFFDEEPVLKPEFIAKPVEGFPSTMIITWQEGFLKSAKTYCSGDEWNFPGGTSQKIFKLSHEGKDFGFSVLAPGGPNAVTFMEEMIVRGAYKFVFIGSCGAISKSLKSGLVIPQRAYRDEGTSWHYIPDKEEYIDIETAEETKKIVSESGLEFCCGSTWTTDGLYRETPSAVEHYRQKGCISVEMECASIAAASRHRKVKTYHVFFTADSLNNAEWKSERLFRMPKNMWDVYFDLALLIADRIS